MKAVSDATPLIHLAKIGKLSYLTTLFDTLYIPREIHEEIIVQGKAQGKSEVISIQKMIESNTLIVREVSSTLEMPGLHLGECKALALCKDLKIKTLLIDEKEGHEAALLLGLKPLRTSALLLKLLKKNALSFKEYKDSLLRLSESGYFLSAETYELLLTAGKRVSKL